MRNSYKETIFNFAMQRESRNCYKTKAIMGANVLPVLSPFLTPPMTPLHPLKVVGCLIKACFHYFVGVFSTLCPPKRYRQKRRGFTSRAKKKKKRTENLVTYNTKEPQTKLPLPTFFNHALFSDTAVQHPLLAPFHPPSGAQSMHPYHLSSLYTLQLCVASLKANNKQQKLALCLFTGR